MRHILAIGVAILIAATSAAQESAERFPYSAFVNLAEAPVRSGPGETYYPVLALKHGDAVEVWRHDPGGWCAIRPPEGAFSWISAEFIRQTGESTGVVVGNQVNVRVGTNFSDLRDAVQVRLNEGEAVDLLDRRTLVTGDRETVWYKILPPAGEFRWVHERDLVRHPSQLQSPAAAGVAQPNIRTDDQVRPAAYTEMGSSTAVDPLTARAPSDLHARLRALPAAAPPDVVIDELEAVLSQMVIAEPTAWNFAELEQRANALLEGAESAGDRSRARLFLSKLTRFEDIRKRYTSIAHLREQTADVDRALAVEPVGSTSRVAQVAMQPGFTGGSSSTQQSFNGDSVASTSASGTPRLQQQPGPHSHQVERSQPIAVRAGLDTSRYDGTGRLTQTPGGKSNVPGYALTNEAGEVRAYVAPGPGVNLRQFLGLDVGINGIRSFLPDQRQEQLTAKRIDVLEGRTRR